MKTIYYLLLAFAVACATLSVNAFAQETEETKEVRIRVSLPYYPTHENSFKAQCKVALERTHKKAKRRCYPKIKRSEIRYENPKCTASEKIDDYGQYEVTSHEVLVIAHCAEQ
ncbi:MAG: hypothetical protein ACR2P7_06685 [bacterium]